MNPLDRFWRPDVSTEHRETALAVRGRLSSLNSYHGNLVGYVRARGDRTTVNGASAEQEGFVAVSYLRCRSRDRQGPPPTMATKPVWHPPRLGAATTASGVPQKTTVVCQSPSGAFRHLQAAFARSVCRPNVRAFCDTNRRAAMPSGTLPLALRGSDEPHRCGGAWSGGEQPNDESPGLPSGEQFLVLRGPGRVPCVSRMSESEIRVFWRRLVLGGHSLCDRTSKVSPRQQFFCRRIHICRAAGRVGHRAGTPGVV